jgi:hypothetical protein
MLSALSVGSLGRRVTARAVFSAQALRPLVWALLAAATVAVSAHALVIVSQDGAENVTAPKDDPGWANVGSVSGLTGIYLGNGWMLTASHVGAGTVVLGSQSFPAVPDSTTQLRNPDGSAADLIVFRIQGAPRLPKLRIAAATPPVGTPVLLVGHGRNRGAPLSWSGHDGFAWGTVSVQRWGTNVVCKNGVRVKGTDAFATQFRKDDGSPYEAQAAVGDSGGATFVKVGRKWRLAGVVYVVAGYEKQPPETALFGNFTLSADLARYRSQIEKLTSRTTLRSQRAAESAPHP